MLTQAEADSMGWERSRIPGLMWHHGPTVCEGTGPCPIHNPSDHPLRDAQMVWRVDRSLIERMCEHGVGHPDPDDLNYKHGMDPEYADLLHLDVHGCDGCCHDPKDN